MAPAPAYWAVTSAPLSPGPHGLLFVFDMDDVLYDYDWRGPADGITAATGHDLPELRRRWCNDEGEWARGGRPLRRRRVPRRVLRRGGRRDGRGRVGRRSSRCRWSPRRRRSRRWRRAREARPDHAADQQQPARGPSTCRTLAPELVAAVRRGAPADVERLRRAEARSGRVPRGARRVRAAGRADVLRRRPGGQRRVGARRSASPRTRFRDAGGPAAPRSRTSSGRRRSRAEPAAQPGRRGVDARQRSAVVARSRPGGRGASRSRASRRRRAGARISAPCSSPCSSTSVPPGRSRRARGRRDGAHDVEPVRAAVERVRRVVQPHLGVARDQRRPGCRAGSRRRRRRVPSSSGSASARSPKTRRALSAPMRDGSSASAQTKRARRVPRRRRPRACGTSVAIASAIAPLPVPRSTRDRRLGGRCARSGVDRELRHDLGLGPRHEDAGADGELDACGSGATPVMCCSGSRRGAALDEPRGSRRRPSASSGPLGHGAAPAPGRGRVPSTCPSSSSASTCGVGDAGARRARPTRALERARDVARSSLTDDGRVGVTRRRRGRRGGPPRRPGCTTR